MNRREFLTSVATKAAGGAVMGLAAGCTYLADACCPGRARGGGAGRGLARDQMADGDELARLAGHDLRYGQVFAEAVAAMTGGKFVIEPRAGGELAPPLQVLDVVSQGAVPIGHTASYYYVGKTPATAFGTSLPFGLNAQQQNAWLYEAGGLTRLQELYANKFNVIQFPAGNTGVQMGGWFRKEINTVADLQGLKMRISGVGGQVMAKLGVNVQVLPAAEIFQALQTGAIDAAEWVGPYDDEKLGLNKAADFYYTPAWWEPGPALEIEINLDEWKKLPEIYQAIVQNAAAMANVIMLSRYEAKNVEAMKRLLDRRHAIAQI